MRKVRFGSYYRTKLSMPSILINLEPQFFTVKNTSHTSLHPWSPTHEPAPFPSCTPLP